tara:strand:- start:634 stop:882 length:249 start_codon:yes stop_codon:yes gene_type:complete
MFFKDVGLGVDQRSLDGIYANASIFHVLSEGLFRVFVVCRRALKSPRYSSLYIQSTRVMPRAGKETAMVIKQPWLAFGSQRN